MGFRVLGVFLVIGVLGVSFSSSATAAQFTDFGPYKGKVVDAETKEPIEGAVVHVVWRKLHAMGDHKIMDAQETKTDKNGNFEIPGITVLSPWTRLTSDVNMLIYKSEYELIDTWSWDKWKEMTPKDRWIWKMEEDLPVFILKRLVDSQKRRRSLLNAEIQGDDSAIPYEKKALLLKEISKETSNLKTLSQDNK